MAYYGVHGPKGTAEGRGRQGATAAVKKTLEDPNVRKRIEGHRLADRGNTPEQFAAQMKAELDVYKTVVDQSKLKLD
jgi:tripartite-type tricarboxylate transporter receptor subunit TctC